MGQERATIAGKIADTTTNLYLGAQIHGERIVGQGVYATMEATYRLLHHTPLRRFANPPHWFDPENKLPIQEQLAQVVTTYCCGVSTEQMESMRTICQKNNSPEAQELSELFQSQLIRNEETTREYLRRYPVNVLYNALFSAGFTLGSIKPELLAPIMGTSVFASINAVHRYTSVYDKMNTDLRDLNTNGLLVWRFFDLYQKGVIQNVDDQIVNLTADILKLYHTINDETTQRGGQLGSVLGTVLSGDLRQTGVAIMTLATAHSLAWLATRGQGIGKWFVEADTNIRHRRQHAKRIPSMLAGYVEAMRSDTDQMTAVIHDSNLHGKLPQALIAGAGQFVGSLTAHGLDLTSSAFPFILAKTVGDLRSAHVIGHVPYHAPIEKTKHLQDEIYTSYQSAVRYFNELLSVGKGQILEAFSGALHYDPNSNKLELKKYLTHSIEWREIGNWHLQNGVNILLGPSEVGKSSMLFFLTTFLSQANIHFTEATNADPIEFAIMLAHQRADVLRTYILDVLQSGRINTADLPDHAKTALANLDLRELAVELHAQIQSDTEQAFWIGWADSFKNETSQTQLSPQHALLDIVVTQFLREKVKITTNNPLRNPNSLGAQQRIKFAKTIIDPTAKVVILDETINNIDGQTKRALMREFASLIEKHHSDKILILTTHDAEVLALQQKYTPPNLIRSLAIMESTGVRSYQTSEGNLTQILTREKWHKLSTQFVQICQYMHSVPDFAAQLKTAFESISPQITNTPDSKSRLVALLSTICGTVYIMQNNKYHAQQLAEVVANFIDNLDYDPLDKDLEQQLQLIKAYYMGQIMVGVYCAGEIPRPLNAEQDILDLEKRIDKYHLAIAKSNGQLTKEISRMFPEIEEDIAFVNWYHEHMHDIKSKIPEYAHWAFERWFITQKTLNTQANYDQFYNNLLQRSDTKIGLLLSRAFHFQDQTPTEQYAQIKYYLNVIRPLAFLTPAIERTIDDFLQKRLHSYLWLADLPQCQRLELLNEFASFTESSESRLAIYLESLIQTHDLDFDFATAHFHELTTCQQIAQLPQYGINPKSQTQEDLQDLTARLKLRKLRRFAS